MRMESLFLKLKSANDPTRYWNETRPKLQKKIERLNGRNTGFNIDPFHRYDATTIVQLLELPYPDLEILARSDFAIENYYREKSNLFDHESIFVEESRESIPCAKFAHKIVLQSDGKNYESWSRLSFLTGAAGSKGTKKHIYAPKNKFSMFLKGFGYNEAERTAIFNGSGLLENPKRLFMYARFEDEIGVSRSSKYGALKTAIIKVQVDRVLRPKRKYRSSTGKELSRSQGYQLEIHGYPICEGELEDDFPEAKNKIMKQALKLS
jgi:hypothetical protein